MPTLSTFIPILLCEDGATICLGIISLRSHTILLDIILDLSSGNIAVSVPEKSDITPIPGYGDPKAR